MTDYLLDKAFYISLNAHEGKKDRSGNDYVAHSMRVASCFQSKEVKVVALMHNSIHSMAVASNYFICQGFPLSVVDAVLSVTPKLGESRTEFIQRAKRNTIGRVVEIVHILDKMRLEVLETITKNDALRIYKYVQALRILN